MGGSVAPLENQDMKGDGRLGERGGERSSETGFEGVKSSGHWSVLRSVWLTPAGRRGSKALGVDSGIVMGKCGCGGSVELSRRIVDLSCIAVQWWSGVCQGLRWGVLAESFV